MTKQTKNNIIVFALEREEQHLDATLFNGHLNNLLETNLTVNGINNLFLLGKQHNAPIKVELISYIEPYCSTNRNPEDMEKTPRNPAGK